MDGRDVGERVDSDDGDGVPLRKRGTSAFDLSLQWKVCTFYSKATHNAERSGWNPRLDKTARTPRWCLDVCHPLGLLVTSSG